MATDDFIKILITIITTLGGAWVAGWWTKRGKELETTAAPYDALANRVTRLENQVSVLQSWVALSSAIHTDVTNRWEWYRTQNNPPVFPPSPNTSEKEDHE